MRTYHDVLGVPPDADEGEIKTAYRRLAKTFHPDVNIGDREAARRFVEISEAYDVLKGARGRAAYRRHGRDTKSPDNWRGVLIALAGSVLTSGAILIALPFQSDNAAFRNQPKDHLLAALDQPLVRDQGSGSLPVEADSSLDEPDRVPLASATLPASPTAEVPQNNDAPSPNVDAGNFATVMIAQSQPGPTDPVATAVIIEPPAAAADKANAAPTEPATRPTDPPAPSETETKQIDGASIVGMSASEPARPRGTWATYRNVRFKFALDYPADLFVPVPASDNARRFITRDGRARLVITSSSNSKATPASLRRALINDRYGGATFDYIPVGKTWFVLSGTQGEDMFYERVSFACDGRIIHGWQLTYPAAERALYDTIVEGIHRTYKFRAGADAPTGSSASCISFSTQSCAEPWPACTTNDEQPGGKPRKGQESAKPIANEVWP